MPADFDPRTIAKLKGLVLRARHIVEGYIAGLHRSPYRGFSIEFAEHREYVPGDDLRYLDWKVFGRTDKFYLKQFEDETNLIAHLVVDVSESMNYRGPHCAMSKLEYAQCLAASMAWLVLQQQDAVGLTTYDDQLRTQLRPNSQSTHWKTILESLERVDARGKTKPEAVFKELAARWNKRGVVIIFSDLITDLEGLLRGLKQLKFRQHDVALFQILDPAELDFPFSGERQFHGLEQLPDLTVNADAIRRGYQEELNRFLDSVRASCHSLGMDHQLVRTDQPFDQALASYLSRRLARVKP